MVRDTYIRALAVLLAAMVAATLVAVLVGSKPAEAAFPGANGKIAFYSDRTSGTGVDNPTGDREIFAMNPDGTGVEQLTFNTAQDEDPAWSAQGNAIAFTSNRDGNDEIYLMIYGGIFHGFEVRLTNNTTTDEDPAFSPADESKIAFTSFRDNTFSEIYVMNTSDTNGDGNAENQTNLTNNTALDGEPNWSPDGSKIAFARILDGNSDIYMMNADGTEQKRRTKKAADDYRPAFSPDGKKIAFTSDRGGDPEVYVMKAGKPEGKKNRPKNLTKNDGVSDRLPDWRPIPAS